MQQRQFLIDHATRYIIVNNYQVNVNINAAQSTPHFVDHAKLFEVSTIQAVLLALQKQQTLRKILLRILVAQVVLVQNCMMHF